VNKSEHLLSVYRERRPPITELPGRMEGRKDGWMDLRCISYYYLIIFI
jgi:hypothetical protein